MVSTVYSTFSIFTYLLQRVYVSVLGEYLVLVKALFSCMTLSQLNTQRQVERDDRLVKVVLRVGG